MSGGLSEAERRQKVATLLLALEKLPSTGGTEAADLRETFRLAREEMEANNPHLTASRLHAAMRKGREGEMSDAGGRENEEKDHQRHHLERWSKQGKTTPRTHISRKMLVEGTSGIPEKTNQMRIPGSSTVKEAEKRHAKIEVIVGLGLGLGLGEEACEEDRGNCWERPQKIHQRLHTNAKP